MKRAYLLISAGLLLLTLAIYAPALRYGFVNWDDNDLVVENPLLEIPPVEAIQRIWAQPAKGLYTPLAYTLWRGVAVVARAPDGSLDARPFHALNVILHGIGVMLTFALLVQLVGRPASAALGACAFAIHPVQVEAVTWVSGMNGVLATTLSLAALCAYVAWSKQGRSFRDWRLWASLFFFILALFSKPLAVTVPLIALALDVFLLHPTRRQAAMMFAVAMALAVPFMWVARYAQPAATVTAPPIWTRPLIAADTVSFYLGKLFWTASLAVDYGRRPAWVIETGRLAWTWIGAAMLVAVAWGARRQIPAISAGACVFVAGMAPVLGLVPFDYQSHSTVADRYLYLPMVGVALALSAIPLRRGPLLPTLAALVVIAMAARTSVRIRDWRDSVTLFTKDLARRDPPSLAAYQNLGFTYARQKRPDQALYYYTRALELHPGDAATRFNLANLLLNLGRPAEAIPHYRQAVELSPERPQIRNNLGVALRQTGAIVEAEAAFRAALAIYPDYPDARVNLALLLADLGRRREALEQVQRALDVESNHRLGRALLERLSSATTAEAQPPNTLETKEARWNSTPTLPSSAPALPTSRPSSRTAAGSGSSAPR